MTAPIVLRFTKDRTSSAVVRLSLRCSDLDRSIVKWLNKEGISFTSKVVEPSSTAIRIARRVKESVCFVPDGTISYDDIFPDEYSKLHELPDGENVRVRKARWLVSEALFKPILVEEDTPGLAVMAFNSITKSQIRRCNPGSFIKSYW